MNVLSGSANFNETANGLPYAANLTAVGPFPPVWVNPLGQTLAPQPNIAFAPQIWNRSIRSTTRSMAWALAAGFGFKLTRRAAEYLNRRGRMGLDPDQLDALKDWEPTSIQRRC